MENYRIYWNYGQYNPVIKGKESSVEREFTQCVIETPLGESVSIGTVKQYHKDVPNRKIARKESFKRAVAGLATKEERKMAWSLFNTKYPKCVTCN